MHAVAPIGSYQNCKSAQTASSDRPYCKKKKAISSGLLLAALWCRKYLRLLKWWRPESMDKDCSSVGRTALQEWSMAQAQVQGQDPRLGPMRVTLKVPPRLSARTLPI